MARPGASRSRAVSLVVLCVALVAVLGAGRWIRSCKTGAPHTRLAQRDAPASGRAASSVASSTPASAASLTVVVSDEHGPLRDAVVRLTSREGEIVVVKSGADGAARADRLAPGNWRIMNFDSLRESAPAMGLSPGGNDPAPPPVLTDAQGHYQLGGLFHVEYTVIAEGQRGQLRAKQSRIVPDATVNLQTQGVATLSGTATGPDGPARVFTVTLHGPTLAARSVTDGKFVFDHIPPGAYTVYAESLLGGGLGQITVAPGASATIDIALSANGTVTGTLVDAAGKPAADMRVVGGDDNAGERVRPPATSGPDGSFRIDHAPCTCWLAVSHPPARPFVKTGVAIEPGKVLDLGRVVLDAPR